MKFLCKLFGCKERIVEKIVPEYHEKIVYRDRIVHATKEPAKPRPLPVLSGSIAEQAEQVRNHYGVPQLPSEWISEQSYIDAQVELAHALEVRWIEVLGRLPEPVEIKNFFVAPKEEQLRNHIPSVKVLNKSAIVKIALDKNLPLCGH